MADFVQSLRDNPYPGRGIVAGRTPDGARALIAYFIMGRSTNSRNRIFVADGDGLRTQAHDPALLTDPSLVIYAPVRVVGADTIVTNGDQTDTIAEALRAAQGGSGIAAERARTAFDTALLTRTFEPDPPNYTPRISALLHIQDGALRLVMSILKSDAGDPASCLRHTYDYETPRAGIGRFLHTYQGDGNPLPSFEGEPETVDLAPVCGWDGPDGGLSAFTDALWGALNEENRVSLFTRTIDLTTGQTASRIVNRHGA